MTSRRHRRASRRGWRRITGSIVVVGALALAATACGGDDDDGGTVDGGTVGTVDTDTGDSDTGDSDTGDSDTGGSGDALSDDAFCARIEAIGEATSDLPEDEADSAFFEGLADLVAVAPNDDVRSALVLFGEVAAVLDDIDEDDPDAFAEAFGIIFDPKFLAATETLDGYFTDVCGFDEGEFDID